MKTFDRLRPWALFCIVLSPMLPPDRPDIDLLKLSCFRNEQQNGQKYESEITFVKSGHVNIPKNKPSVDDPSSTWANTDVEGQVMSYLVSGGTKTFISGYSLFSISYHDQIISGMTGDPMTTSDGSFTLTRMKSRNNGPWLFSFTGINGQHIEAEFRCKYAIDNNGL